MHAPPLGSFFSPLLAKEGQLSAESSGREAAPYGMPGGITGASKRGTRVESLRSPSSYIPELGSYSFSELWRILAKLLGDG